MNDSNVHRLLHCMQQPLDPARLRAIFLLLLRSHFTDRRHYGYMQDDLGCLVYSDDPGERTLHINLTSDFKSADVAARPAIYVGLDAPFKFGKVALDNAIGAKYEDNSVEEYNWTMDTTVNVSHLADSPDLALNLATATASFLTGIRPAIMRQLELLSFDPVQLIGPKLQEKPPESYFQVDLHFAISFNFVMAVNIESHRIKKISLDITP